MTAWDFFNGHTTLYVVTVIAMMCAIVGGCGAIGEGRGKADK